MYLLFDIGATKTRLAHSDNLKELSGVEIFNTPHGYESGLKVISDYVAKTKINDLAGICGCIPGELDKGKNELLWSPNMHDWRGRAIKDDLTGIFGCDVHLGNDASFAALGEANLGAGKGYEIVAYLTISTGIGGARIVNGKLDRVSVGFEPGFQIIGSGSSLGLGEFSPNEKYPNGFGYFERVASGSDLAGRTGEDPKNLNNPDLWEQVTRALALGLNNIVALWSPGIIVLGGGIILSGRIDIPKLEKYLKDAVIYFPEVPGIRKASLGDSAGLYGALVNLEQKTKLTE